MCRKEQTAFQILEIFTVMTDLTHFINLIVYHRYFHSVLNLSTHVTPADATEHHKHQSHPG